jgi:hypothetical protein
MINRSKERDQRFWNRWERSGAVVWVIPPPCEPSIFTQGEPIAALDARKADAEQWVRLIARRTNAKIDWHYSGGLAQVLHLGDADSRERVVTAMRELKDRLKGKLLQIYGPGQTGLNRAGVTQVPEGAIGSWMNPNSGEAVYAVA